MKLAPVNDQMRAQLMLQPYEHGVAVLEVAQNSAAARRRITAGEVIEAVGERPVSTLEDVQQALKAITDRHAILGMDREEVVAAIGKPDRKVRERDSEGYDTEDWIYGHPPDKTVFVHFRGDKVSSIKQYPQ